MGVRVRCELLENPSTQFPLALPDICYVRCYMGGDRAKIQHAITQDFKSWNFNPIRNDLE